MKAVIYMYEKVLLTEEEIAEDTGISLRRVRKIIRRYLNGVAVSKI
jgi:transcription initiation factor IIE alpha subunit